jgi:hypothetical protein
MNKTFKYSIVFLVLVLTLWTCADPWEDHLKITDGVPSETLFEQLQNNAELSEFTGLLLDLGWQEELESTKSYTIWAPDNSAMTEVDPAILADTASMALFVNNHIVFGAYSYYAPVKTHHLKTFSGKNVFIDNENGTVEDANLREPYDQLCTNGILHIIDKPLTPKPNVWDIVEATELAPMHVEYLNGLSGLVFDPSLTSPIGVDPVTGKPVYDTLSGMVWSNKFLVEVRDLMDEDSLSTILLVDDPVFEAEFAKYRPYFKLSDSLESDELTRWMVAQDFAFRGKIKLEDMPDTLISLYGIKIPFDPASIQKTYEASNGLVYVMSACDVVLGEKIPPTIVQGEDTTAIVHTSASGQTGFTRPIELASGGYDFLLDYHGANPGHIKYHMSNLVAGFYDFYWVAVNDFDGSYRTPDPTLILEQQLEFVKLIGNNPENEDHWDKPTPISPEMIQVVDSTYESAREVYLGNYYILNYQDVWLQVTGTGRNSICLDYLKAVPRFE